MSETLEQINKQIEQIPTDDSVRDSRFGVEGEVARQGDVYLHKVNKHSDIYDIHTLLRRVDGPGEETQNRQLAPGSTKGSRHILVGEGLTIYEPPAGASPLEGPYIEATEEFMLTHPEHGDHKLAPGKYVTTYQRDFSAEEIRRVMD
jgi:hypothetical protein